MGRPGQAFIVADTVVLGIFLAIYAILACLSCLAFTKARKGRRAPAVVLFLSLLCCILETCSGLATLGSILSGAVWTGSEGTRLVLWFITAVTTNWMLPLLFLSICLLFRERLVFSKLPGAIPRLRWVEIIYWTSFAVIILAGSGAVPFAITFQKLLWEDGLSDNGGQVFGFAIAPSYIGLSFGISSLFWLSAAVVVYFARFIKKKEQQFTLSHDRGSKLLNLITPIYIAFIIQGIIFSILISIGGSDEEYSFYALNVSLCNVILFNVFYCVITGLLVMISRRNVMLHSAASSQQNLQLQDMDNRSQRSNLETGDSQSHLEDQSVHKCDI